VIHAQFDMQPQGRSYIGCCNSKAEKLASCLRCLILPNLSQSDKKQSSLEFKYYKNLLFKIQVHLQIWPPLVTNTLTLWVWEVVAKRSYSE
jgi:hypothetical protein